ncbi:MAG: aryl-sulfate sulfotransferase [Chitinophagales bacterium]
MMKISLLSIFLLILIRSSAQTVGLFYNDPGSLAGYILFAPGGSDSTYLIDKCGKRVHTWFSSYLPGLSVHLNTDGTLLRCGGENNAIFNSGGSGGILEKFDWNDSLLWSFEISDQNECQHHEAIQLPNGNVLAIVWQKFTKSEAIDNGRDPASVGNELWSDKILEIEPIGTDSGVVVWQWNAWDHLIQDFDSTKQNFGVVASHPELIDINAANQTAETDWLHCNSIDYNSHFDQILISCHNLNEVWIIDHSTTMAEAVTHSGGQSGKGGDLLYRWGNPQIYNRGTSVDQKFFGQHNATWIPAGLPDAGKILVFNNGIGRPDGLYSTVETFTPPDVVNYNYPIVGSNPYGPTNQDWVYEANPPTSFFSQVEGGAQRLSTGIH